MCQDAQTKEKNMYYDLNLNPSHYLKNDLESLLRLENIMED